MSAKIILAAKVAALGFLMAVLISISSLMAGVPRPPQPPPGALAWLLVSLSLEAGVMTLIIRRSVTGGWRLSAGLFFVYWSLKYALTLVEGYVFLDQLVQQFPAEVMAKLMVGGTVTSALVAPAAVALIGAGMPEREEPAAPLPGTMGQWAVRLLAIGVVYNLVYFSFGFCVAMPIGGPEFDEYYAGLKPPAWLPLMQMARAMVWAAAAVVILRLTGAGPREGVALVALAFCVFAAAQLLIPGPVFPERLRLAHLAELASSGLVFGWLAVSIIIRRDGAKANGGILK